MSTHQANQVGLAAESGQEVVITLEALANTDGPQPAGDGAAALGEAQAHAQRQQPPGVATVQDLAQGGEPRRHLGGQFPRTHPWLSCWRRRLVSSAMLTGEPLCAYPDFTDGSGG